ncbi:MAG TPA: membrane protein insertase YidC [Trueperaceae bacterium]|nr:membrane protein insertase YidC [Trueperaceae bacterium]
MKSVGKRALAVVLASILGLSLMSTALAFGFGGVGRVVFEASDLPVSQLKGIDEVRATCSAATPSFLCEHLEGSLTRIPTKGTDFLFTPAGELAGAYVKVQRGQTLNDYQVAARNNLIPFDSAVPGGALLVDGEYLVPQEVQGEWTRRDEFTMVGTFTFTLPGLTVERTVVVSNVTETSEQSLAVTRTRSALVAAQEAEQGEPQGAGAADAAQQVAAGQDVTLQVASPGIARTANAVVKIGYDQTFALNPGERTFSNPTYAAMQKADNNRDEALIMLPGAGGDVLEAGFLRPNLVFMQTTLAAGDGEAELHVDTYAGRNELVRYEQEGYLDLPGLFRPNILGRLSLLIVNLLQWIHQYVPSWGLSIIVLTLMFRVVVWPLISTQTRSMFGMQGLQPKIKELQRKHKDDREKLTQETMKLYREAGVNPAGGCLPILLQMPLFIILWRVFVNFEFAEGFLWLPDLGQADPLFILPVLYVAVMVATSYFSARGNPQMLRQSMIINVVFVFVIVTFPAGVLVYYVVSMLVQVFQYWLISRGQPAPVRVTPAVPAKRGK